MGTASPNSPAISAAISFLFASVIEQLNVPIAAAILNRPGFAGG